MLLCFMTCPRSSNRCSLRWVYEDDLDIGVMKSSIKSLWGQCKIQDGRYTASSSTGTIRCLSENSDVYLLGVNKLESLQVCTDSVEPDDWRPLTRLGLLLLQQMPLKTSKRASQQRRAGPAVGQSAHLPHSSSPGIPQGRCRRARKRPSPLIDAAQTLQAG